MNAKERFDSTMKIAEFNIQQFNERRGYSWKISLSFWGAIIGSIAVLKDYVRNVDAIPLLCFVFVVGILVSCFHCHWLKNVFEADKTDKNKAFEAEKYAISIAKLMLTRDEEKYKNKKFWEDWSFQFQFGITILLIVSVLGILILENYGQLARFFI